MIKTIKIYVPRLKLPNAAYTAHYVRPNFSYAKTSFMLETLYDIASKRHMLKYLATNVKGENNYG